MNPMLRLAIVAAGVTLLIVVAYHLVAGGSQSGWEALAEAADPTPSVESLETARDRTDASAAAPWADYRLAMALYDRGEPGDHERAVQVAREAVAEFPEHVVSPPLERLVQAVESYSAEEG